jgi:hypothetical protein
MEDKEKEMEDKKKEIENSIFFLYLLKNFKKFILLYFS